MLSSGIYCIRNRNTDKVYIGSSCNINERWNVHRCKLKQNAHHSKKLQNSWNKHSESVFDFQVLEYCEESRLIEREQYFIDFYDAYYDGYNTRPLAGNRGTFTYSDETKLKMKEAAILFATTDGESERRSERAAIQHLTGNLGRATWSEEAKLHQAEIASAIAHKHKPWLKLKTKSSTGERYIYFTNRTKKPFQIRMKVGDRLQTLGYYETLAQAIEDRNKFQVIHRSE